MSAPRQAAGDWPADALRECPTTQSYLIGVSAGRDSVALLHWLLARGYRELVICHLDHRLRGRSSAADARFVTRLAETNALPCETGVAEVRKLAAGTKQSLETAARAARYSFFAKVARRRRCHTIFLGHHADDQVETFIFNLFRGTGAAGQRAMSEISTRPVDGVQLTVLRPLLSVCRSEIDEYVRANGLRFREDATNNAVESLRNRIRHRIIPFIEKEIGRDIRRPVRRAAMIAAEEDALLNEMLPQSTSRLSVARMRDLPVALQRRAIAQWLRAHGVVDVGFDMVETVRSLLDLATGRAKVNLTGNRHARRRAGELFVE